MEKFSSLNEQTQLQPKYVDKTKQEIYSLIKDSMTVVEPDNKMNQIDIDIDELTNKLYNLVQKEKVKEEISTLESIKTIMITGPFNFQHLNEQIEKLKKDIEL